MTPILSLIALVLFIYAIVNLVEGRLAVGIGSLLAAMIIGPGGISLVATTTWFNNLSF